MAVVTQAMQDNVTELYIAFFGRAPDASGFSFWTNALANGKTPQQIADVFMKSPEFSSNYDGLTPSQQVDKIYLNVLNRDATTDPTGKAFWVNALNSGVSVGQVAWSVVNSAWEQGTATADGKLVHNKVSVGEYFALTLASNDTAVAATAYKVNGVPVVTSDASSVATSEAALTQAVNAGATFTLTTNADNIVGTDKNDTINGYVGLTSAGGAATTLASDTTFQVIDTIDGKGGVNSINLTVAGASGTDAYQVFPAATVSNLQKFNIRDVSTDTNAHNYNFGLFSGETLANSSNSTHAVTFYNLGDGAAIGASGSTTGAVTFGKVTASDAINVVLNGATGTATITNNATVNSTAAATTATSATITSTEGAAASTAGAIRLTSNVGGTAGAATLTSLNVVAGSDLTATLTAGDFSTTATTVTLNVAGAGAVNLGSGFTGNVINAATNTGGLTITSAASTKTFVGGTGKDVLTLGGALTTTGTVDLGAGNDILLGTNSTYVASTNTVDGGAGIDAVAVTLINAGNGGVFKNFEQVDLKGGNNATVDLSLLTGSTIQSLLVSGDIAAIPGVTVTNVAAGVDMLVTGTGVLGGAKLSFANATGSADVFAINFANASKTASTSNFDGSVQTTGIETINVSSAGANADTVNTFANLKSGDNSLSKIVITGANDLTISNVLTDVDALITANTASNLTLIDGSAATGDLNITAGATHLVNTKEVTYTGLTVKTGSGNDIVVANAKSEVVSTGNGNDTVTTQNFLQSINVGAGNDKVVVGAGSEFTGSYVAADLAATVTGFGVGDKIDVTAQTTAATAVNNFTATALTKSTLAAAIDAAIAATGEYQFINWTDGNTYFVTDGTDDSVVALVGTYTSFSNTAGVISLT